MDELDGLGDRLDALDEEMGGTDAVAARFGAELAGLRRAMMGASRDAEALERSLGQGLRRAMGTAASDGLRLTDALRTVATSLVDAAHRQAVSPVARAAGSALGGLPGLVGPGPSPSVTVNVSTPDVAGFRRSESQIAAGLTRALARGVRNR